MSLDALLAALAEPRGWLERFTRRDYERAFGEYTDRFAPAWRAAAGKAGEEGLSALAEEVLDALAADWRRRRPWDRTTARLDHKQLLVDYLSPMLLLDGDPGCRRLAELLRDGWAARWPRDAYRIASYARIQKGFRNTILGFEVHFGRRAEKTDAGDGYD